MKASFLNPDETEKVSYTPIHEVAFAAIIYLIREISYSVIG